MKIIATIRTATLTKGSTLSLQKAEIEGRVFWAVFHSKTGRPHMIRDTEADAIDDMDAIVEADRLAARTPEQRRAEIKARSK